MPPAPTQPAPYLRTGIASRSCPLARFGSDDLGRVLPFSKNLGKFS